MTRRARAVTLALVLGTAGITTLAGTAVAHGSALGGSRESVSVPTWLFLTTGGGAVGASFLLASLVTDRSLIEAVHATRGRASLPPGALVAAVRVLGMVGLAGVLVVGFLGPAREASNAAVLFVWVGWWAGYTASTYLVAATWDALNPFRTLAAPLPTLSLSYSDRLGAWPAVAGLLGLIWVEVVSPLASAPRLLALVVTGYGVLTVAGAIAFGDTWFEQVDPVSRVFRYYGRLAPITRGDGDLSLRLPGAALSETTLVDGPDEVAFVVALLWGTTFDGLVATGGWAAVFEPAVETVAGPLGAYPTALAAYLLTLVGGFLVFLGVYRLAGRYSRRMAPTYLATATLVRRFAPPLLAIAAGYHLAHYLGYFLRLAPSLLASASAPFSLLRTVPVLALPGWFDAVPLLAVLLGHVVAIWAAHATAFDLFPGRLQAIRSQYPYIVVMVLYTMSSLWIVSQPTVSPPFIA